MLTQHLHGERVQGDPALPRLGLGRKDHQVPVSLLQLPRDAQDPTVQVDVTPAQPRHLTAPQTPKGGQMEGFVQPVVVDAGEKLASWVGVRTATAGRIPNASHVATTSRNHTTADGRRERGNLTCRAGFKPINPSRRAAFNAADKVA